MAEPGLCQYNAIANGVWISKTVPLEKWLIVVNTMYHHRAIKENSAHKSLGTTIFFFHLKNPILWYWLSVFHLLSGNIVHASLDKKVIHVRFGRWFPNLFIPCIHDLSNVFCSHQPDESVSLNAEWSIILCVCTPMSLSPILIGSSIPGCFCLLWRLLKLCYVLPVSINLSTSLISLCSFLSGWFCISCIRWIRFIICIIYVFWFYWIVSSLSYLVMM